MRFYYNRSKSALNNREDTRCGNKKAAVRFGEVAPANDGP